MFKFKVFPKTLKSFKEGARALRCEGFWALSQALGSCEFSYCLRPVQPCRITLFAQLLSSALSFLMALPRG